ncbi:hypothetical protein Tco_0388945, partial [Tanacetum coccineum]
MSVKPSMLLWLTTCAEIFLKLLSKRGLGIEDDILVLSHEDLESIKVIKKAMDVFNSVSGLNSNM